VWEGRKSCPKKLGVRKIRETVTKDMFSPSCPGLGRKKSDNGDLVGKGSKKRHNCRERWGEGK